MRRLVGSLGAALAIVGLPSLAAAQHSMENPKHELGVDLGLVYSKPKGGVGVFSIGTPVDVRIGFATSGRMQIEPRFTFNYASGGGNKAYAFTPDVNLLFGLSADNNKKGPYVTVGAGVNLTHREIGGTGGISTSQFNFNGGIGTRIPYESGAFRLEAFARYLLENTTKGLPSTFDVGARIGLSLWH